MEVYCIVMYIIKLGRGRRVIWIIIPLLRCGSVILMPHKHLGMRIN